MTDIEEERKRFEAWIETVIYPENGSVITPRDIYYIARSAWLARARLDAGWRPIESAPIEQTVICYHPMYGRFPGYQRPVMSGCPDTVWVNGYTGEGGIMPPTHWMPLPNPPKEDGE